MLKKYFIGDLQGGDRSETRASKGASGSSGAGDSSLVTIIGIVSLLGAVAGAYFFYLKPTQQ